MKSIAFVCALLCTAAVNGLLIPVDSRALAHRDPSASLDEDAFAIEYSSLERRKGGGGGGGGAKGGSSGGSSSGSSSSGAKSGGSSSSGSSSSGSSSSSSSSNRGAGSTTSNTGGRTTTGSGAQPVYGGYYGGGASVPYAAGARSTRGLLPLGLFGLGAAALIFPGLWLASVYYYPWSQPYNFYNSSAGQNQTKPVLCMCQQYSSCGCDENSNSTYINNVIGDGNFSSLNKSLAYVNDVNGTSTILINGTLPNGTTASGGTDSASAAVKSAAGHVGTTLLAVAVCWFVWM